MKRIEKKVTKPISKNQGGSNMNRDIKKTLANETFKTLFTDKEKEIISIRKMKQVLLKEYWSNVGKKLLPGCEFCFSGLVDYFKCNFEFDYKTSWQLAEIYHLLLIEATLKFDCRSMDEDGFFWLISSSIETTLKMPSTQVQQLLNVLATGCNLIVIKGNLIRVNIFNNYDILCLYIDAASC